MSGSSLPWMPANPAFSRRQALKSASGGFGLVALAGLLGQTAPRRAVAASTVRPSAGALLAPKSPQLRVKAKRIIFLFMEGATSQVDTWEYKPKLQADHGKVGPGGGILTGSKFHFAQHGQTGTWVSELYPHMAKKVDQLCFIRGLHTDTPAHPQAVVQLHTGAMNATLVRPSMGAWLLYGLGTENQDLPGYITINPPPNFGGALNYGTRVSAGPLSRDADQRHGRDAQPAGADGPRPAAPPDRPDPGDEPRPGR